MSDIAIRAENLSKQYRIGARMSNKTLREALASTLRAPTRWLAPKSKPGENTFWALDNVSFEIKHGEAIGIIGRNGAGKSTLLKILSRITKPTHGRVELYGRVGSLLEVGTGFHSELTGRENIFLNGAILGMSRREIERKFDEIVDFAEIEKFLDTPAKHYSSGMYMRLAFAVAAHLEPEILVVDEVLAVGDVDFQKKSLGKMEDITKKGRAVLFVSHNIGAIMNLCKRGLLLDSGKLLKEGMIEDVVESYLDQGVNLFGEQLIDEKTPGASSSKFAFSAIRVLNSKGQSSNQLALGEDVHFQIEFVIKNPIRGANVAFHLWNHSGICVMTSTDVDDAPQKISTLREAGTYIATCVIPAIFFKGGIYSFGVSASIPNIEVLANLPTVINFNVVDLGSVEAKLPQNRQGIINPVIAWDITKG